MLEQIKLLAIAAVLPLSLTGCLTPKKPLIVVTPIERVPLTLPNVDSIDTKEVEWTIITVENYEDVYIEADERLINLFVNSFGKSFSKNFIKFGHFSKDEIKSKIYDEINSWKKNEKIKYFIFSCFWRRKRFVRIKILYR